MSDHPDARVEAAAAEYLRAVDRGSPPNRAEFLARYPALAADLGDFLDDLAWFRMAPGEPAADTPAVAGDGATQTFDGPAPGPPAEGPVVVPDYDIDGEVGRGGMGVVYRARQRSLNRIVALKMIAPDRLPTRADHDRFRLEAEAAAALDHPNIVPIFEVGEAAGRGYFTMKLVAGGSLGDRAGERVAPPEAARLVAVVARAVEFAHLRGILHRDLKPSNILIDASGTPLIADFGLAKRLDGPADASRSGVIVGTPAFMSPEQARGERGVSTAADVYGLGAILYDLLTGRPPFRAPSPAETLVGVLSTDPARPRALNSAVPADLEAICLKCLAKAPGDRYPGAGALAEDLDRWGAGEPILARRAGPVVRAAKWVGRNPAGAGLVALGGLTGAAVLWAAVALSYNAELTEKKELLESANTRLAETNEKLDDAFGRATREKAEADGLRGVAENQNLSLARLMYLSDFRTADRALRDGQPELAANTLDGQRRDLVQFDEVRGFEWNLARRQAAWVRATGHGKMPPGRGNQPVDPQANLLAAAVSADGRSLAPRSAAAAATE